MNVGGGRGLGGRETQVKRGRGRERGWRAPKGEGVSILEIGNHGNEIDNETCSCCTLPVILEIEIRTNAKGTE